MTNSRFGAVRDVGALARSFLRPERLDRLPRAFLAMAAAGPTMAGAVAAATARYPHVAAVVDDEGTMSYYDLWRATDALARGLHRRGVREGSTIGILARNHRGFVLSLVAAAKVGADLVYLNTGFAGPQLADVAAREGLGAVLYDDEYEAIVAESNVPIAVSESAMAAITGAAAPPWRASRRMGRTVILTSGTTGRPKGAVRSGAGGAGGVGGLAALLSIIPIRARSTTVIAAPLFHAWGLGHMGMTLATSSTAVLERHFDPERTLALVERHQATGLIVVPVMLQRILALGEAVLARYDTSSLRYIASSGSALGAPLATATMERFGPILYNVYGSTEVALASVAGPEDLTVAPSTAGRPVRGSDVRIYDDRGQLVPVGTVGRVFVGNPARFEGYTGGGGKESIDGLLSIGDLGHLDADGRLFLDGRDDEMIVSGGENVYPAEVEELLARHPAVLEAAVIGVPDEEFGQRLKAFVVLREGGTLTVKQARDHVRGNLANYKVPKQVVFLDALPRTTTGKVRKRDLA